MSPDTGRLYKVTDPAVKPEWPQFRVGEFLTMERDGKKYVFAIHAIRPPKTLELRLRPLETKEANR